MLKSNSTAMLSPTLIQEWKNQAIKDQILKFVDSKARSRQQQLQEPILSTCCDSLLDGESQRLRHNLMLTSRDSSRKCMPIRLRKTSCIESKLLKGMGMTLSLEGIGKNSMKINTFSKAKASILKPSAQISLETQTEQHSQKLKRDLQATTSQAMLALGNINNCMGEDMKLASG